MNAAFDDCIKQLKREIRLLEKEVRDCVRERDFKYARHYQKALWRTRQELDRLTAFAGKKRYLDAQEIDDALVELYEGSIQRFSLILQPHLDFYLHFSLSEDRRIECWLPTEEELHRAYVYVYMPSFKRNILGLGFAETGVDGRLCQRFVLPPSHSCQDIKAKLSVLMFNILHIGIQEPFLLVKSHGGDPSLTFSPVTSGPTSPSPRQAAAGHAVTEFIRT